MSSVTHKRNDIRGDRLPNTQSWWMRKVSFFSCLELKILTFILLFTVKGAEAAAGGLKGNSDSLSLLFKKVSKILKQTKAVKLL